MFLVSSLPLPNPLKPVLSREWRCSWSSAHRRCSNCIWVINNSIAYQGATYIRGLTIFFICPTFLHWRRGGQILFASYLNIKEQQDGKLIEIKINLHMASHDIGIIFVSWQKCINILQERPPPPTPLYMTSLFLLISASESRPGTNTRVISSCQQFIHQLFFLPLIRDVPGCLHRSHGYVGHIDRIMKNPQKKHTPAKHISTA